jgi:hypothetical protein
MDMSTTSSFERQVTALDTAPKFKSANESPKIEKIVVDAWSPQDIPEPARTRSTMATGCIEAAKDLNDTCNDRVGDLPDVYCGEQNRADGDVDYQNCHWM